MNQARHIADFLVTGSYLSLQDKNKTIIANGGVAIHQDTIVETGVAVDLAQKYPDAELLATAHGLIMPGLVNTHTHAAMACFRGLADYLPIMQMLQEDIFSVEAKLNGSMVYQASLLAVAEMIKSGTTSFCDISLFAGDVARAVQESGMRAWIGEFLHDSHAPDHGEAVSGFQDIEELFTLYDNHPLISVTVVPYAVHTFSPDLLKNLRRMAEKHDALYIIHLSETGEEVKDAKERYGPSPLMHFDNLGLLDGRVVADHCVMLTDAEIELLARRKVKIVHCPESNMKLVSGIAPVPRMLAAGISVGLGTGSSGAHNALDMFGEMNWAAKLHKVHSLDPTILPAETVLEMATMGGARVLGAEKEIGSLEPGKKADLIVLDLNQPHLTPLYTIPSHMVYAARGADVIHSVINGRVVMKNRVIATLDEGKIVSRIGLLGEEIKKMRG